MVDKLVNTYIYDEKLANMGKIRVFGNKIEGFMSRRMLSSSTMFKLLHNARAKNRLRLDFIEIKSGM